MNKFEEQRKERLFCSYFLLNQSEKSNCEKLCAGLALSEQFVNRNAMILIKIFF